ncbi:MAG: zinc ribbon domain-containing protein [Bacilli bacterium]|nr:zinc ribbon domain-containing protein [Bacilli bacterium]
MKNNKHLKDNPQVRRNLRIIGFVALILGGLSFVYGLTSVMSDTYDPFHHDGINPQLFIFFGFPLAFVGFVCLMFGYMGAISRYQSSEVSPVVKDTVNYLIDGTKDEVADFAAKIKGVEHITCPNCGDKNDSDALYCDNCGRKLKINCGCGTINEADSKYCKKCGKKL